MMNIRWGILGTGAMAQRFVEGLKVLPDTEVAAVASRYSQTANIFADTYNIPIRHDSYAALAHDQRVDAVYIATPNTLHKDHTILCLQAGKPVLCEKPFAVNSAEAAEMVSTARLKGCLLMEAMWMRFVPAFCQVRTWLNAGEIGDVRMVQADFGFRASDEDAARWLAADLAGGALMFVGIYPVSFASLAFSMEPQRVAALAQHAANGIDEQTGMILQYDNGGLAVLACAVRTKSPRFGAILGTKGMIRLHEPFYYSPAVTLAIPGREPVTQSFSIEGDGYHYEAAAFMASLRNGERENPLMPLDESVSIMQTMDRLRAQLGLVFP